MKNGQTDSRTTNVKPLYPDTIVWRGIKTASEANKRMCMSYIEKKKKEKKGGTTTRHLTLSFTPTDLSLSKSCGQIDFKDNTSKLIRKLFAAKR